MNHFNDPPKLLICFYPFSSNNLYKFCTNLWVRGILRRNSIRFPKPCFNPVNHKMIEYLDYIYNAKKRLRVRSLCLKEIVSIPLLWSKLHWNWTQPDIFRSNRNCRWTPRWHALRWRQNRGALQGWTKKIPMWVTTQQTDTRAPALGLPLILSADTSSFTDSLDTFWSSTSICSKVFF